MLSNKPTYNVRKLVQHANLGIPIAPLSSTREIEECDSAVKAKLMCPLYKENHPGLDANGKWTPGRVFSEKFAEWSMYSKSCGSTLVKFWTWPTTPQSCSHRLG